MELYRGWAEELLGRSGFNLGGANPLSPSVLRDWSEMYDYAPLHPLEVFAVTSFHDAMISTEQAPATPERNTLPQGDGTSRRIQRKWPERKKG